MDPKEKMIFRSHTSCTKNKSYFRKLLGKQPLMKKSLILMILLTAFLSAFFSCKDTNNETDYNPNVRSSKDLIYAEDLLFEVINIYFQGITDSAVLNSRYAYLDNCSIEYLPDADSMHFHYGPVNRWCPDNKFRRGAVYAHFTGPLFTEGSQVSLITDSLFVDDDHIEGQFHSEFLGNDGQGRKRFSISTDSCRVTLKDTLKLSVIRFSCDYTITWVEGAQTPNDHSDDMLAATGTVNGKSTDNYDFQSDITDPLVDFIGCNWIERGIHQISTPSAQVTTGTIDYISDDECNYAVNFYFGESYFYDYLKH